MIERMLVPLDGSATAEGVLPQLRRLLRRSDSEVILVRTANPMPVEGYPAIFETALAAAREYLLGVQDRLSAEGVRVKHVVRLGAPADTILQIAREEKATMIALATHGHTGLARLFLGSVAERILRRSPIPVLVVRPFWSYEVQPGMRPEEAAVRNILVPLDGSDLSLKVLPRAMELAVVFGARVVLLHVLPPGIEKEPIKTPSDRDVAGAQLEELSAKLRAADISVLTLVDEGDPAHVIGDVVRYHDIDVVAMTTHGRSGLSRLVTGSVTETVIRQSRVPVLVVRAQETAKKIRARAAAAKGRK